MKKYLYLTSLLALTACFGGGGGGSAVVQDGADASMLGGRFSSIGLASNRNITNMASGIVVAANGSSSAYVRGGSTTVNGHNYNIYDLSDVKFRLADNSNDYFQFHLAEDGSGAIDRIVEHLGETTATVDRIGDTQRFNGPIFELVKNGGHDDALYRVADTGQDFDPLEIPPFFATECASGCHWNYVDEIYGVNTEAGNGYSNGTLTYSDFGRFNPVYQSKNKNLTEEMLTALRHEVVVDGETITVQDYIRKWLNNPANTDLAVLRAWLTEHDAAALAGAANNNYVTAEQQNAAFASSEDFQLFAGGYAIKNGQMLENETLKPTKGMTFTGKAIGRVYTSIQQNDGYENRAALLSRYGLDENVPVYSNVGGDNIYYYKGEVYNNVDELPENAGTPVDANSVGHDMAAVFTTTDSPATLTVTSDTGSAILSMPFNNFYTVTTTSTVDTNGNATYTTNFADAPGTIAPQFARDTENTTTVENGHFGYYGINTPTEAAGTIQVSDTTVLDTAGEAPNVTTTAWRDWEFQGAYGMNKDN